jgi:hypothetical protein
MTSAANEAVQAFARRFRDKIPGFVSVRIGSPVSGIPTLIVLVDGYGQRDVPERFRGMLVQVCRAARA